MALRVDSGEDEPTTTSRQKEQEEPVRRLQEDTELEDTELEDGLKPSPWSQIYDDALLPIFDALLPPVPLLHDSTSPYLMSTWRTDLRMRKSLTRTCSRWREAALPLLYAEVTLGHVSQIFAFVRTVLSTTPSVGHLVRTVHFVCPYVPKHLRHLVSQAAVKILQHCKNITGLRLGSEFWNYYLLGTPFELSGYDLQVVAGLRDIAPRLTMLRFEEQRLRIPSVLGGITPPFRFLSTFTALQHLTLTLDNRSEAWRSPTSVQFDNLEHLTLYLTTAYIEKDLTAIVKWRMPHLERMDMWTFTDNQKMACFKELLVLFKTFGLTIRKLTMMVDVDSLLVDIVNLCPSLEYLYCRDQWSHIYRGLISRNPPIQLDISGSARDIRFPHDSMRPYSCIRVIDKTLLSLPELPLFLPRPLEEETANPSPIIHHVHHMIIIQTSFAVFPLGSAFWNRRYLTSAPENERVAKLRMLVSALQKFFSYPMVVVRSDLDSESSDGSSYEPSDDEEEDDSSNPDVVEELFSDAPVGTTGSFRKLVWSDDEVEPVYDEHEVLCV